MQKYIKFPNYEPLTPSFLSSSTFTFLPFYFFTFKHYLTIVMMILSLSLSVYVRNFCPFFASPNLSEGIP